MTDQPSGPYHVVFSQAHLAELQRLRERAKRLRVEVPFLLDVLTIRKQLAEKPAAWGDPAYPLRNLGLMMYHRVEGMLSIYYAVDEERRIVYPSTIKPLPNHPLGQGD
jgi:hypothetical protein